MQEKEKMIKRNSNYKFEIRENMRGGNGNVKIEHLFDYQNELKSSPRLLAKLTLEPGVSIGFHEHFDEEEVFYIANGTAEFFDGTEKHILHKGDSSLTGNGGHSLANIGEDNLEVIAVILKF